MKKLALITIFLLWILPAGAAHSQGKGAAAEESLKSLLEKHARIVSDYEPVGKVETLHLAKYKESKEYVKEKKLKPGYCYRFFIVSSSPSANYRIKALSEGKVFSMSLSGPWAFADYCLKGDKDKKVRAKVSWKDEGGKVLFAIYRKSLEEAATKDDTVKNLIDLNLDESAAIPLTGHLEEEGSVEFNVPSGKAGCQVFHVMPGEGLEQFTVQLFDGKKVLDSLTSKGGGVRLPWCSKKGMPQKIMLKITAKKGSGIFSFSFVTKAATDPIGVGGESSTSLLIKRIHSFLKKLSPGMAPQAKDNFFHVTGEEEKAMQLPVKKSVCYRMAAAGDPKVEDITMEILLGKGKKVTGKKVENFVMADLCPKKSGKVKVQVRGKGVGYVAFSSFAGSPEAAAYAAGGASFDLEELLDALGSAKEKYGEKMDPSDTPSSGILKYGETAELAVQIDKDYCYKFIAVSSCQEKCGLELSALKAGKVLVSDKGGLNEAVVEFCPGETLVSVAAIKLSSTERGKEAYAFIPMRKKAKAKLKIYAAGEAEKDYIAKKIIEKSKTACKGMSAVSPVLRKKLKTNESVTFTVKLAGEVCYTILAIGKPSVKDIKVTLFNPIGQEIGRDNQSSAVGIVKTKKCPQWDGKYKIKVRMFMGYGDVGLQVFGDVQ